MESKFTVFYSWQSDLPSDTNKSAIDSCIKQAINATQEEILVDRDTQGVIGTYNIDEIIFNKIINVDYFIADVSLVGKYQNTKGKGKNSPNPNVLLELGFAAGCLSWDRVLCIFNEAYGKVEDLPFDLGHKRVLTYNSSEADYKQKLIGALSYILGEAYKLGFKPQNGLSLIKILGYDHKNHLALNSLIGYKLTDISNYVQLVKDIIFDVKKICTDIGKCKVEPRVKYDPKRVLGSASERLADITWNKQIFIDAEPVDLSTIIKSLKEYFGLEYDESYFSFGNLKVGTNPILSIPGFETGPALEGTNDEKKKRKLYINLQCKIHEYELLKSFVTQMHDYVIYPLIIENDSLIKDDDIEIDLFIDENTGLFNVDNLFALMKQNEVFDFVGSGLFTKLFYNKPFSNEISNEERPTEYPRVDMLGKVRLEDEASCIEEFYNLFLPFTNGVNGFEGTIFLSECGGHKLLVAISDVSQTISLYYPGISETRIYTDLTVTADEWRLFTITWNTSYIKIYLDNQTSFSRWHNSAINLSNLITYISCNYIDNKPIQHLNGVIEMLTYSNSYMTSIHSTLLDGGTPISHITSFDELERPCLKETLTSKTRLTHKYDYYDEMVTENNDEYYKASSHPCVETLEDGTKIVYFYDSSGNITGKVSSKKDVLGENISYEYDASGRLVDEICYQDNTFDYHYRYTYNTNSDIIEIVGYNSNGVYLNKRELVYNSIVKGQINKVRYYSYERHWNLITN